jgi:hypothetical protein
MQAELLKTDTSETMTEKRVEIYRIERLETEQKSQVERADKFDKDLNEIRADLRGIRASIIPPIPTPDWVRHFIYPSCVLIAAAMVTAVITLLVKVNGIEVFLHDNAGVISGLHLQQSAGNPTIPRDVAEAKKVLETAKAKNVKIDANIVENVGKRFVEAGIGNEEVWSAALAFVGYRSFLNSRPNDAVNSTALPPQGTENYTMGPNILNFPEAKIYSFGSRLSPTDSTYQAPADRAAFRPIGTPDANEGHVHTNSFLLIAGADLVLDNLYARNVVVENSHVTYRGGPLILSNVTFINCTFDVVRKPIGQEFAEKALASVPTFSLNIKFDAG